MFGRNAGREQQHVLCQISVVQGCVHTGVHGHALAGTVFQHARTCVSQGTGRLQGVREGTWAGVWLGSDKQGRDQQCAWTCRCCCNSWNSFVHLIAPGNAQHAHVAGAKVGQAMLITSVATMEQSTGSFCWLLSTAVGRKG